MGFIGKRKVWRTAGSRAIALPAGLAVGDECSLAANRLVLLDPRGEIPARDLLDLLEGLEPQVWKLVTDRKKRDQTVSPGG